MSEIPKIIHQLWIGNLPAPINMMKTWKDKHPDFEYIFWNEEQFKKRDMNFECIDKINSIEEINGKADIIRWEILYKYGGLFLDADSICIEPCNELLEEDFSFCSYENEKVRPGLVATGTMCFPKNYKLCKDAIEWIKNNNVSIESSGKRAWINVGPGLLTMLIKNYNYEKLKIYPSYYFLPIHPTGVEYNGHKKVYAFQEWASTKKNYNKINNIQLPDKLVRPKEWVSVLVSSYNTKEEYICECLESLLEQNGNFGMEVVWINDGSDEKHTKELEKQLDIFYKKSRFIKILYKKWEKNMGIGYSLHEGIKMCNNEIIMKVDSDDIIKNDRFIKQIQFMQRHSDCVLCGTDANYFNMIDNKKTITGKTNHKELLTWDEYKKNPTHWFINHPCVCYKKSAILEVGNYNNKNRLPCEDFELELKLLKRFGKIYNIQETLLYYRLHETQMTANNNTFKPEVVEFRNNFIKEMIENDDVKSEKVFSNQQTISNLMPKIENNLNDLFSKNKSIRFKLVYQ
jgi:glycosyltransferase involved in cell wall biosynthesis